MSMVLKVNYVEKGFLPDLKNGMGGYDVLEYSYRELKEAFGAPNFQDVDPDEKVNAEWYLQINYINDDTQEDDFECDWINIYNWKTGGITEGKMQWHVKSTAMFNEDVFSAALDFCRRFGIDE